MSYPSRAALKLRNSLDHLRNDDAFRISVKDRLCLDLGCAHGGFVQVLLEEGARCVYAVDVGYGILDYKLRIDLRVVVRERENLRNLSMDWFSDCDQKFLSKNPSLSENPSITKATDKNILLCTCDASFISSKTVLSSLADFHENCQVGLELLLLIKPQFEASNQTKKGIIEDVVLRQKLVDSVEQKAIELEFEVLTLFPAQPQGRKGNQEYMLYARRG